MPAAPTPASRLRQRHACAIAGLFALATIPAAQAQEPAQWTGQVTPYVWGAGLSGDITPFTGAPTLRIDKSFSEVLEDSDGAFFLSAYARRDRLVLLGDLSYSASSKDGLIPPGLPAEGSMRQTSLTLAAGRRVHQDERIALDLLAGLRHWSVSSAVDVPLAGIARSPGDSFTDPILAARANLTVSPRWSLIGYADVGGFGVGSQQTHQWLLVGNYQPSERWVFSLGLRQLSVDYHDGGTRVDVTLTGPLLGASWRF